MISRSQISMWLLVYTLTTKCVCCPASFLFPWHQIHMARGQAQLVVLRQTACLDRAGPWPTLPEHTRSRPRCPRNGKESSLAARCCAYSAPVGLGQGSVAGPRLLQRGLAAGQHQFVEEVASLEDLSMHRSSSKILYSSPELFGPAASLKNRGGLGSVQVTGRDVESARSAIPEEPGALGVTGRSCTPSCPDEAALSAQAAGSQPAGWHHTHLSHIDFKWCHATSTAGRQFSGSSCSLHRLHGTFRET